MAVDTSGEYFWDIDRLRGCGNDLIFELEITRTMYVDIITASVPVSVWLDVWGATDPYSNISSEPLADIWNGAEYILFPTIPRIRRRRSRPDNANVLSFSRKIQKFSYKAVQNIIMQIFQLQTKSSVSACGELAWITTKQHWLSFPLPINDALLIGVPLSLFINSCCNHKFTHDLGRQDYPQFHKKKPPGLRPDGFPSKTIQSPPLFGININLGTERRRPVHMPNYITSGYRRDKRNILRSGRRHRQALFRCYEFPLGPVIAGINSTRTHRIIRTVSTERLQSGNSLCSTHVDLYTEMRSIEPYIISGISIDQFRLMPPPSQHYCHPHW